MKCASSLGEGVRSTRSNFRFEYEQNEMPGPPFAVMEAELHQLFGEQFNLQLLEKHSLFHELTNFQHRGLQSYLLEKIYHLKPDNDT